MIGIIDCGTSWLEEIVENVRKTGHSYQTIKLDDVKEYDFKPFSGIIISGAPTLLTEVDLKKYLGIFKFVKTINVPVFGICLGHQLIGLLYGAEINRGEMIDKQEAIDFVKDDPLFDGVTNHSLFREEHSEYITLPEGFYLLAKSSSCDNEVMRHKTKTMYGTQFHPEVSGESGATVFKNFLKMCSK